MKLTPHFSLHEFERSAVAERYGIKNVAPATAVENLTALCRYVLEPAREKYGKPIIVHSGYRCKELNKRVGGVATSQHMSGMAADLTYSKELFEILAKIKHDQLILESAGGVTWIHVSFNPFVGRNRNHTFGYSQKSS